MYLIGLVDLIILEHMKLNLLFGVLNLLWLGVSLLLTFLASSTKTENKVKGGFLLDVVILEGATVLKLLARCSKALLRCL